MGRYLPNMRRPSKIRLITQSVFGGLDHREGAADGSIHDMTNMTGEHYPLLSPRRPRRIIKRLSDPYGIYAHDGLIWADGGELWHMREQAVEIESFSGSGVVQSNGTVLLDVDTDAVFDELLRYAERKNEVEHAYIEATYYSAGLPMKFNVEITDLEVSNDRKTVMLAEAGGIVLRAKKDYCRFEQAFVIGAPVGEMLTVTFKITFPKTVPVMVGLVSYTEKKWASMGSKVVIFPDKLYLDTATGEFGSLEAMWSGNASIGDGTYGDSPAVLNTITAAVNPFPFNEGDAVTVSVTETDGRVNNGTFIIRGVSEDKLTLTFLENTFKAAVDPSHIRIERTVPDLDYICESGGRLWGCKGDEIFASKLGDVFNWNSFDGISTDSWSVKVPSAGDFTGCVSYLGMPTFFKEDMIYKIYGSEPKEYQLLNSEALGCDEKSGASVCAAGDILMYVSRGGVVAYTGSFPRSASAVLGTERLSHGVAGSDGIRYYLSCRDGDRRSLYVYDTEKNLWHREDDADAIGFAAEGDSLYMLTRDGVISAVRYGADIPEESEEETVISECVFSPYTASGDTDKKGVHRVTVRCEIFDRSNDVVELYIRYNGIGDYDIREGAWESLGYLAPKSRNSFELTFVPRRCDSFSLMIRGRGSWRIHSVTREYYVSRDYR